MRLFFFGQALILLGLSGCASTTIETHELVFFPPAPDPPRVQFLLGIGDSRDVAGRSVETTLFSYGSTTKDEVKSFIKPYGIATYKNYIYVSDTMSSQVAVINLAEKSFEWLEGNFGPGKLQKPTNLTCDRQGYLYVADTALNKVLVYDLAGHFVRTYGEGYRIQPIGVAADDRWIYVLDKGHRKILIFNKKTGKLLEGFGQGSDNPVENLTFSTNMALTEKGIFYIADAGSGRVVSFDLDGHFLNAFGKLGDGVGQFARPKGIAADDNGRVYTVDAVHKNVQIFNNKGQLLMFFGLPGQSVGSLDLPASLTVTDQNLDFYQQLAAPSFNLEQVIMVVNQIGRHRLKIYGLGKQQGVDYETYYRKILKKKRNDAVERLKKKQ